MTRARQELGGVFEFHRKRSEKTGAYEPTCWVWNDAPKTAATPEVPELSAREQYLASQATWVGTAGSALRAAFEAWIVARRCTEDDVEYQVERWTEDGGYGQFMDRAEALTADS